MAPPHSGDRKYLLEQPHMWTFIPLILKFINSKAVKQTAKVEDEHEAESVFSATGLQQSSSVHLQRMEPIW